MVERTGHNVIDFAAYARQRGHASATPSGAVPGGSSSPDTAFELYRRASELDEDPATVAEAELLYRKAIGANPLLALAYTNLGIILFRRGDEIAAESRCGSP